METAVRKRVLLFLLAVVAVAAGIGARLTYLQIHLCEQLRGRASTQHWREIEVPATRGAILDRQGGELALSLKTESLFAHPRRVTDHAKAARLLAPIVSLSRDGILKRLQSGKTFVYIDRFLEPEQAAAIRALDLPIGDSEPFGFLPSSKRYYPRGKLAVHVLGFANIDGEGVEGIEKQYDYDLRGDPTVYLVLQDGLNGRVRRKTIDLPDKQPRDVILSIDTVLQHVVERELDRAIRDTRAKAASAILMEPGTGQILALANRPAADLNRYSRATDGQRINRAVVHQYEPGSTFKIVSMAAALERRKVRPDQRFNCEQGAYIYRGRRIRDIARHGILSASEVFEKSSNVGMVKIMRGVDAHDLHDTIVRFGFGSRTGIELPGELPGSLRPVSDWSAQTKPSLAFGYEIGATVVQMAGALSVIANQGVRVPARVVLGVRDANGRVYRFEPPDPYAVVDRSVARELTAMMEGVVLRGSGTRARVPGYRIAGKSGTARKIVGGRYSDTDYVASFGGFAPASAPRLVALVVLDTPRGLHYGGQVAAPVFRRIMENALSYVRAPRDEGAVTLAGVRRPSAVADGSPTR
jgi:cell division protein FtsI/penicillin-binding protein 2